MRTCPQCGSTRLKRSHSRDLKERFLKYFRKRAYRCIHCGWRGILEGKSAKTQKAWKYTFNQIFFIVLVIVVAIIVVFYMVLKEEGKQDIPAQSGSPSYWRRA